jgi:hypothetical protein
MKIVGAIPIEVNKNKNNWLLAPLAVENNKVEKSKLTSKRL